MPVRNDNVYNWTINKNKISQTNEMRRRDKNDQKLH